MANLQPMLYYEVYVDGIKLPYNPENLKFHISERETAEHALTQVPAIRYGLPPTVETLTFDIRIPRAGDPRYFQVSLKSVNTEKNTNKTRAEFADIRGALSSKMRARTPVEIEIVRFSNPLVAQSGRGESLNIRSLASSLPSIGPRGQSTHKDKYTVTGLSIEETGTSWFDSTVHVELQKYYRAPRLIGVGVYRETGALMSFSPMGEYDLRTGKLRVRAYTNTSGLGGIYDRLKSMWDSGSENETPTQTLHRYYSNLTGMTSYAISEAQKAAGFVTPFISGLTGVLRSSLPWSSLITTGLSCIPVVGPAIATATALYSTATGLFSGLSSAVNTVTSWLGGGGAYAALPAGNGAPDDESNAPVVDCTKLYWGLGWDGKKHMEYIPNAPLCELPLKIGVELPRMDELLRDAGGHDAGIPHGGDF